MNSPFIRLCRTFTFMFYMPVYNTDYMWSRAGATGKQGPDGSTGVTGATGSQWLDDCQGPVGKLCRYSSAPRMICSPLYRYQTCFCVVPCSEILDSGHIVRYFNLTNKSNFMAVFNTILCDFFSDNLTAFHMPTKPHIPDICQF